MDDEIRRVRPEMTRTSIDGLLTEVQGMLRIVVLNGDICEGDDVDWDGVTLVPTGVICLTARGYADIVVPPGMVDMYLHEHGFSVGHPAA